jgi:hypothetical protein
VPKAVNLMLPNTSSALETPRDYSLANIPLIIASDGIRFKVISEAMAPLTGGIVSKSVPDFIKYTVYIDFLQKLASMMENEILANWRDRAATLTKSAFANHVLLSLTNYKAMWNPEGFFPDTTALLRTEI